MSKTTCHSECGTGTCLYVDDPALTVAAAAAYVGRTPRTLLRLSLERVPMPGIGNTWGYRRSTLNRYLRELSDAHGSASVRKKLLKKSSVPATVLVARDASTPQTALATGA